MKNLYLYSQNYALIMLMLISCSTPQLYSMDSNGRMKTARNNTYNATTLFGDSEPLGIAQKKERTNSKEQEKQILELNKSLAEKNTILANLIQKLTKPDLPSEDIELFEHAIKFTQVNRDLLLRKGSTVLGPNNNFYRATQSRSEILNDLKEDLTILETIKNFSIKENLGSAFSQQLNLLSRILEREQFMHRQLEKYNLPDAIGIDCSIGDKNTGLAVKNPINNHEYIELNYNANYPLFAIQSTGLHEIGHVYYGDNYDLSRNYNKSPLIASAQIAAPFISYFTTIAALKSNVSKRAALPLGIVTAASLYAASCASTYKKSRDIELRADTFAVKKLLHDKNFMALYDRIFYFLDSEEHCNTASLETKIRARFGTHPQDLKRSLNCIKLLEENGTPFNKKHVAAYLQCRSQENQEYCKMLMKKYLPADTAKRAIPENPENKLVNFAFKSQNPILKKIEKWQKRFTK